MPVDAKKIKCYSEKAFNSFFQKNLSKTPLPPGRGFPVLVENRMKNSEISNFFKTKFVPYLSVWIILTLVFTALYYGVALNENREVSLWTLFSTNIVRFSSLALLAPFIFRLTEKFPLELKPFNFKNLFVQMLASPFFLFLQIILNIAGLWLIDPFISEHYPVFSDFFKAYFFGGLYTALLFYILLVLGTHAFLYYRNFREGEKRAARLTAQLAESQLQALKMQLHPHFLFNTLHSISALTLVDPKKANRMISLLGEFLRRTLETSAEQTVALREEIEFLRSYLQIEQIRFEERLKLAYEIEPEVLQLEVPHLILQPLVENAVRHAISPRAEGGTLSISASRAGDFLKLEVRDDGGGIKTTEGVSKNGIGLKNVRARLEQLYGENYSMELQNGEKGLTVAIKIPANKP
jgi:Putative regulator of cell autolysis